MNDFGFTNEVSDNTMTTTTTQSAYPKDAYVDNCHLVNCREKAKKDSKVLMTLSKRCKVSVTGDEVNGFYPVKYNETNGFIMAKFLEVK